MGQNLTPSWPRICAAGQGGLFYTHTHTLVRVCMCMCVYYNIHIEVRGQPWEPVLSLHHVEGTQMPLTAGPSCQPHFTLETRSYYVAQSTPG